jgi:hypothetical protein
MSQKLLEAVWNSGLTQPTKSVLTIYAWYGRDDGTGIFPSVGTVASRTSYSKRSIHSATRKLVEMGVLVPVKRRGNSRGYVMEYRMDISRLPERALAHTESTQSGAVRIPTSPHWSADSSLQFGGEVRNPAQERTHPSAADQYEYKKEAEHDGGIGPSPASSSIQAEKTPEDLDRRRLDHAATHIVNILGLPLSHQLMTAVMAAVRAKAKAGSMSVEAAADFILAKAALAQKENPPKVWVFWFGDGRYERGSEREAADVFLRRHSEDTR